MNPLEKFRAAFPNCSDMHTGGGCMALEIPVGTGYALVTAVDDPSIPLATDEKVDVGFYDAEGEWIDESIATLTWDEAEDLITERMGIPKGWK